MTRKYIRLSEADSARLMADLRERERLRREFCLKRLCAKYNVSLNAIEKRRHKLLKEMDL